MIMTVKEKEIVKKLNHPLYNVEFLEEWLKRNDNVFVNAPSALQAMGAKGYYEAVKQIAKLENDNKQTPYILKSQDGDTGICKCGVLTEIIDEPFYCKYCGQKLSK